MLRSIAAVVVLTFAFASLGHAQTIYAPVQYQYGDQCNRYFYGGSNPTVFGLAERQRAIDTLGDVPFTSPRYTDAYLHRRLIGQLDRVYSDAVPYMNARAFGYLQVDAANDAYANVPRYFHKADLLRTAVQMSDGSRVISAQAQPVETPRADRATTQSAIKPRAIIIIPKSKPATNTSDKSVASVAG